MDDSKHLLMSQGHQSPTQPSASPGYRTDLPGLLTVINNSPSDGLISFSTSSAHIQQQCFPLRFSKSVSKEGSALCPGFHPAAHPAPTFVSLYSPRTVPGGAAISAELGHRAWKKQESTQVTETPTARTIMAQNLGMALWKYNLCAGGTGRWRKCCQRSFIHIV